MTPSTPAIDKAPFGTYPADLAARLDGLKTTHSPSQYKVCGKNANFVEGDGDGDESVVIGPIGNTLKLIAGALRETSVELWGKKLGSR